ncbi:GntR family colanic acid and biofilm gene transcriptional regulator [Paraburkholderia sp. WSM4179]|nr:GntR family colanic acid and biofilm gene transcriptional regulator [Paraburkholderia sp. WSM4179]
MSFPPKESTDPTDKLSHALELSNLHAFDKGSLSSRAYRSLRLGLMRGHFAPGEKLLLKPLAEALGVSITPVREALLQLVSEQALVSLSDRSVAVPLADRGRLREIRDLRIELEGQAIEMAVPHLTEDDVTLAGSLSRQLNDAKSQADAATAMSVRHRFHFHLYEKARRPTLTNCIENLWIQAGPLVHAELSSPTVVSEAASTMLMRALRQRDSLMAKVALQFSITEMFDCVERRYGEDEPAAS